MLNYRRYCSIVLFVVFLVLLSLSYAPLTSESALAKSNALINSVMPLASSTVLKPIADTTVQEAHPNTNYGEETLILGRADGGRSRALLAFNTGEIPRGAVINSARLRLYQGGWSDYSGSVRTISAYQVTSAWHEAVATWNYAPTIGSSIGSVQVGMSTGWYEINVTNLVRTWYAGTAPDFGLMLRGYESNGNVYHIFASREYVGQPELLVDYTLQPTSLDVSSNTIGFITNGQKTSPEPSVLQISNNGPGVFNWTINKGAIPWLNISPTSGSSAAIYDGVAEISVITGTLSPGTYTVPVTVTAAGIAGSPQIVNITVNYGSFTEVYLPLILKAAGGSTVPSSSSSTVAYLIGISDYDNYGTTTTVPGDIRADAIGDGDLVNAHRDPRHLHNATSFAHALEITEPYASLNNLQKILAEKTKPPCATAGIQAQACPCETAIFGYSGHGGADGNGDYFIAAQDIYQTGATFANAIYGDTLDIWLDGLQATQTFVAIDACNSGGLLPDIGQTGRVVVAAARNNQLSWETNEFAGGVFTHYLAQGLMDPAADTNHDGYISAEEAFAYAAPRTDAYVVNSIGGGHHQNPQIADGVTGQLLLAKVPNYGPMSATQLTATEVDPPAGAVFYAFEPQALPIIVTPMQ